MGDQENHLDNARNHDHPEMNENITAYADQQESASNNKATPKRFVGNHSHSLDNKGRIIIPLVYRNGLGDNIASAPSPDFSSIAVYPMHVWEEMADWYEIAARESISVGKKHHDFFMKYSNQNLEIDSQGRILLAANLRKLFLGDEKELLIIGQGSYVAITSQLLGEESDMTFIAQKTSGIEALDELRKQLYDRKQGVVTG